MKEPKFVIIAIVILAALIIFATTELSAGKIKTLENVVTQLNRAIQQKDVNIQALTNQNQAQQKDLDSAEKDLENAQKELKTTKKSLDIATSELENIKGQQATATPVPLTTQ